MLSAVDGGKHPICFSQCPTNLFLFQSTHPSGVRPQWHGRYHRRQLISIHAPQWGATQALNASCLSTVNFNPRTPVGCDHVERTLDLGRAISIHAPQWGATIQRVHVNLPLAISIHAPQWGATFSKSASVGISSLFQSTHPSGVRRHAYSCCAIFFIFQSTHPSGVRHDGVNAYVYSMDISIHAPQWGATRPGSRVS